MRKSLNRDARKRERQENAALRKQYSILKEKHSDLSEEQLLALFLENYRQYRRRVAERRESKEAKRRQKARGRSSSVEPYAPKQTTAANKKRKILPSPSGNLPDWDATRAKTDNDVFRRGRIVSGGGYGLGRNRKH